MRIYVKLKGSNKMRIIIGGAKTGYNLYNVLKKNNIDSVFYYYPNEYGAKTNKGKPINELDLSKLLNNNFLVTSETAFYDFKDKLIDLIPFHYFLRNKSNIPEIAKRIGTSFIQDLDENNIEYPIIIKNKESGETKVPFKTKVIKNQDEMILFENFIKVSKIQKYLSPKEYEQIDVGGYMSKSGGKFISFKEENQYPRGVASYITKFDNETTDSIKEKLEEYLFENDYVGFIEIEFMRNKYTNEFFLMDVNPRVWGSSFYFLNSINNLDEVIYNNQIPQITPKKAWVNTPRLLFSLLKGSYICPKIRDVLANEICYEPYFK